MNDCPSIDPLTGLPCAKPAGAHRHGAWDQLHGLWRTWS